MTLTTQDDFGRQLAEFDKIQETCKKLLQTKHYQALGEAGIHAVMARAKALGIHPFEALNGGFTCIQGKVGMSTEMMAALVRQKGHSITKDPKSTNECVILHGKRKDNGDTWTCTFTKDDAVAAGLWGGPTWKKYPAVMLYNRCMSMLFRQLFPDLSLGAGYVEDELKEITKTGDYAKPEIHLTDFELVTPKVETKTIEQKPVDPIQPHQAEELKSLRLTATEEARNKIDKTMMDRGLSAFDQLPSQSAYLYIRGILLKNQEAVKEEEMVDE
jgi:hypothetical protein